MEVGVWQPIDRVSNSYEALVNNKRVSYCQVSWLQNGSSSDYNSVWIPVIKGDVLSTKYVGDSRSDHWLKAILYPYVAAPVEDT